MSIHEAAPVRRAEALHALAAILVRGHLVVPTCLIAAYKVPQCGGAP